MSKTHCKTQPNKNNDVTPHSSKDNYFSASSASKTNDVYFNDNDKDVSYSSKDNHFNKNNTV